MVTLLVDAALEIPGLSIDRRVVQFKSNLTRLAGGLSALDELINENLIEVQVIAINECLLARFLYLGDRVNLPLLRRITCQHVPLM
jgi:hypothetical protein